MELKINDYQLPEKISFNFEELKQDLTEKVSHYETLVYTDEQIQEAKKDRANMNNLKKALNDERIRREKEYMIPFNDFKSQVNEIISIIDKPVSVIDKQVKEYEEKKKKEKLKAIQDMWCNTEVIDGRLTFNMIFNEKWLNASVSMKTIQSEMEESIKKFNDDMATLANLPDFGFEAQQIYISTLDINKAISEIHRLSEIAKKKAEYEADQARKATEAEEIAKMERVKQEFAQAMNPSVKEVVATEEFIPPVVDEEFEAKVFAPKKQWISFSALLTVEQARELKQFFDSRNIEFKAV